MPTRIGIELSPNACRVVEIDARSASADAPQTVVRSFAQLPRTSVETDARLSSLRQPVAVVAWGLRSDFRQVVIAKGWYHNRRRDAVVAAKRAGADVRRMVVDVAPMAAPADGQRGALVVVAMAQTRDIAEALRPLRKVGVRVRSIVTPAAALLSMARLRRSLAVTDLVEVYAALDEVATAMVLVNNGALVAACEVGWGYKNERKELRQRDEIAERLGDELERFLASCGMRPGAISQVCVCGGLPELRSMTVPLMERLDVEVETLDSLFAIDDSRLPVQAEDFRDSAAELRMAWAVAADWHAPINFMPERRDRLVKTAMTQAAMVAGVATGVGIGWQVQRWWAEVPDPPAAQTHRVAATPRPTVSRPERVVAPTAVAMEQPATMVSPIVAPSPADILTSLPARAADVPVVENTVAPRPAARRETPSAATPQPFDALLGTILYGPDRKVAIVDGRIVEVGDSVRGAQVIAITPAEVLLRDTRGQIRRLTFAEKSR